MNIDDKKGGAISETKVAEEEVTENSTQPKRKSFWTECDQCRIPFEYFDRYFLGHRFRCNGCRGIFVALEVDPPSTQRSRNTGKNARCFIENLNYNAEKPFEHLLLQSRLNKFSASLT
ncbi:hypothetical protein TB2_023580 [Malus domestica]